MLVLCNLAWDPPKHSGFELDFRHKGRYLLKNVFILVAQMEDNTSLYKGRLLHVTQWGSGTIKWGFYGFDPKKYAPAMV